MYCMSMVRVSLLVFLLLSFPCFHESAKGRFVLFLFVSLSTFLLLSSLVFPFPSSPFPLSCFLKHLSSPSSSSSYFLLSCRRLLFHFAMAFVIYFLLLNISFMNFSPSLVPFFLSFFLFRFFHLIFCTLIILPISSLGYVFLVFRTLSNFLFSTPSFVFLALFVVSSLAPYPLLIHCASYILPELFLKEACLTFGGVRVVTRHCGLLEVKMLWILLHVDSSFSLLYFH